MKTFSFTLTSLVGLLSLVTQASLPVGHLADMHALPSPYTAPALKAGSTIRIEEEVGFNPEEVYTLSGTDLVVEQLSQNDSMIQIKGAVTALWRNCEFQDPRWAKGCLMPVADRVTITAENAPAQKSVWDHYYANAADPHALMQKGTMTVKVGSNEVSFPLYCTYGALDGSRKLMHCSTADGAHSTSIEIAVAD